MPPTTRKPLVDGPAGDPTAVVEQVTDGYLLLEDTVIAFADADHIAGIVLLIARRTGLAATTVTRALDGVTHLLRDQNPVPGVERSAP